jgi:hypothetical protein
LTPNLNESIGSHIRITFVFYTSTVIMGCGMSTEDKEGKARNEEIENQLKRDKMLQRNEIKMLLLGMTFAPSGYPHEKPGP